MQRILIACLIVSSLLVVLRAWARWVKTLHLPLSSENVLMYFGLASFATTCSLILSSQTPRHFPSPYWSNRSLCKYGGGYDCSLERLACDRDLLLVNIMGGKTEPSLHVPETHHWAINIYEDLVGSDGFYHNYICGMRNQRFYELFKFACFVQPRW
jgi:hypothetical protein